MKEALFYVLISVFIVSFISFIGLFTFSINAKKLNKIILYLVSFSAGALLGDAFIHLIPELVGENGLPIETSFLMLGGILLFFITEKVIHWHHHHEQDTEKHTHTFAIMNLFGDGVHNFIDGLIIGASYIVSIPVGIATTIAVIFHEIPQEIGDFGVLIHGGFSKGKALFFNFLTALSAVLGGLVAVLLTGIVPTLTSYILPIAIGGFVYIAGSDLIPELNKHNGVKKSILQILSFIAGILVMALLLFLD